MKASNEFQFRPFYDRFITSHIFFGDISYRQPWLSIMDYGRVQCHASTDVFDSLLIKSPV